MHSKADISQLNLLHGTKNKEDKIKSKTDMLKRNGQESVESVLKKEKERMICETGRF